ncbi:D-2-hydroxyacid dehydrogenase [Chryseomicrobium palamuruense]|uniref:D-2-hydroxyacid dehydrogenase n=1 Tax=Chryseomicrobium palamuruense TaxID=682973 RepID=A0ABV8UWF6_9BACL
MIIQFTFEPKPKMQKQLIETFTQHEFLFAKGTAPRPDTEIWVTYGEDVTKETVAALPQLKWISVASAGIEKMPLVYLSDRQIHVTNARGIHKTPMAESIVGHILSLYRSLPAIYQLNEKKEWDKPKGSRELRGETALILGPGAIGAEVARLLTAFGVHIIACNRSGNSVEEAEQTIRLDELTNYLGEANIVLSLLPSTNETRHLLTNEHFEIMKEDVIFMNFGRGDVVAEKHLVAALESSPKRHAVLDVFEVEPLPPTSKLWQLENAIISPHISSHSAFYVERAMEIFSENLSKWESGDTKLRNLVDLKAGY